MGYQVKFRLLIAFFMSLFMAAIMSGVIVVSQVGITNPNFLSRWLNAFLFAWPIALPSVFIVAPIAQFLVAKILPPPDQAN